MSVFEPLGRPESPKEGIGVRGAGGDRGICRPAGHVMTSSPPLDERLTE